MEKMAPRPRVGCILEHKESCSTFKEGAMSGESSEKREWRLLKAESK